MKHWCIFILMLLLPIAISAKGQSQNEFQMLVEKYQQGLITSINMLCTHNYNKVPFKLRCKLMKERKNVLKEEGLDSDGVLNRFVGGGSRYLLLSGVASTAKACLGLIVTIRIISPKGKMKIIRKTAEKMHDYLYERVIPIERIEVNAMEVFRINEIREDDREWVVYANRMTYKSNSESLYLTVEHPCEIKTILCLTEEKHQLEIKEYGYSLLLSDIDVTIWTKN